MPVRPVNSEALDAACQEVAVENHGFLYTDDPDLRQRIKSTYSNQSEVQSFKYASSISASKIESFLDDLAASDEGIHRLEKTNGFFYDPFSFAAADEDNIELFSSVFEYDTPVVRERKLESAVQDQIHIAGDDIKVLLDHYVDTGQDEASYLERVSGGGTTVYFPGKKLYQENRDERLATIEDELASETASGRESDGTVNRFDIEQALGIEAFDAMVRELEERGFLLSLQNDDRWLVNTDDCVRDFTDDVVANDIAPEIKSELHDAGYALPASRFERSVKQRLRNEIAAADKLEQHDVLDTTVDSTVSHLNADGESIEAIDLDEEIERIESEFGSTDSPQKYIDLQRPDVIDASYYLWRNEFEDAVRDEIDRLEQARGSTDRRTFAETQLADELETPGSMDEHATYLYVVSVLFQFKKGVQ